MKEEVNAAAAWWTAELEKNVKDKKKLETFQTVPLSPSHPSSLPPLPAPPLFFLA